MAGQVRSAQGNLCRCILLWQAASCLQAVQRQLQVADVSSGGVWVGQIRVMHGAVGHAGVNQTKEFMQHCHWAG